MITELNASIQNAIRESLPAAVGEELKQFITKAQETQRELERSQAALVSMQAQLRDANDRLSKHRELDHKLEEIASKERGLQDREVQLRLDTAMNRAMIAEGKLETGLQVMGMVFRNFEFHKNLMGSVPVAADGCPPSQFGPGGPGYVSTHPVNTTETTKVS